MGADVIYTYKKLLPRMFVILLLWSLSVFVPFVFDLPPWAPFWFAADFTIIFVYLVIEFRHASKLVKGTIENVPISDLTKAIYWLSIIGARKMPSTEDFRYYGSVTKVISKMGTNFRIAWQEIQGKHRLPDPMTGIYIIVGIFTCLFGIVLSEFLKIEMLSWIFIVPIVALFIIFSVIHKRGRESMESLIASDESTSNARWLAQELISWASERTSKPLKVKLAEANYSSVKMVETVYGVTVVEIEPIVERAESDLGRESALRPVSREYRLLDAGHEKWEPLWISLVFVGIVSSLALSKICIPFLNWIYQLSYSLVGDVLTVIAAIVVVSLPFVPIELFFRGKHLTSSIPVLVLVLFVFLGVPILEWVGLSERMAWRTFLSTSMIVVVALFMILLYFGWPFLRIVFRGGVIEPSDLEGVVRRFPARFIRRIIKQEGQVRDRLEFLIALYSHGFIAMAEVPESIKEWINEDARQPQSLRYFTLTQDSVSLTELSKPMAKALQEKLGVSPK